MSDHARLGPSNHRWPHCPGSIREEERYPDVAGDAAVDGTGTHLLLEMCLENAVTGDAYLGQTIGYGHREKPFGWQVSQDRIDRVNQCLAYVRRRVAEIQKMPTVEKVEVLAEARVRPCDMIGRDDWWGTCDITIIGRDCMGGVPFLEAADYKDGRGFVPCDDNTQLLSYAIGRVQEELEHGRIYHTTEIQMTIVQPKTFPVVRATDPQQWSHIKGQWVPFFRKAAEATDDENAPCIPGDHCKWCKANPKRGGHCQAPSNNATKEITAMSGDVISIDGGALSIDVTAATDEELAAFADKKAAIEAVFESAEKEIKRRIESGREIKGFAVGPGKRTRVWADQEKVAKAMKGLRLKLDDHSPRTLVSPAQFEKLVKSGLIKQEQCDRVLKEHQVDRFGADVLKRVSYEAGSDGVRADAASLFSEVPANAVDTSALPDFLTDESAPEDADIPSFL